MGSLFAALTTAVSGLNAQSSAIGNISDNLANAQTVGFKGVGTNFEDLVNASNATVNNPGGVRATPQYQNDTQGSITSSNVSTNLAISGAGYFAVESASQDSTGTTIFNSNILYTRQGDFSLDKDGFLVNGSGFFLTAYNVSTTGVVDTSATHPVQVSASLSNPVATSNVTYDANLPSNATTSFQSTPSTVQVFDALGNSHDLTYTWTKSGVNTWSLEAAAASATPAYDTHLTFTFNDGTSGPAGTIASIAYGSGSAAIIDSPTTSGSAANVDVSLTFPGSSAQTVTLKFGNYDQSTGVTQFSDANTAVSVTNFNQNGLPRGSFNSFSISKGGLVSINYSNGTNRTIAQIPIVQFFAEDQLQRISGGAFEATLASGSPRYGLPGQVGAGTISSSSLEQSNVDIAAQFTNLIQSQQVYSANAKVVTTDNSLLQVTINMVQ
jgi:flagellar hook protein FlgE